MDLNIKINLTVKQVNGDEVLPHHVDGLRENAIAYILEMVSDDCREGEFNEVMENICDDEETEYRGYWSVVEE